MGETGESRQILLTKPQQNYLYHSNHMVQQANCTTEERTVGRGSMFSQSFWLINNIYRILGFS